MWGTGAGIVAKYYIYTIRWRVITSRTSRPPTKKRIHFIFYMYPSPGEPKIARGFGLWAPLYVGAMADLSRKKIGSTCKAPIYHVFSCIFLHFVHVFLYKNRHFSGFSRIYGAGVEICAASKFSTSFERRGVLNYGMHDN